MRLVFIAHGRRKLVHVNVTANPTAAWVWRQVIEATPWGNKPRHVLHDRDAIYGRDFRRRAKRVGIDGIATPIHAPQANAIIERVIGTLRRECLDHLMVLDEQHLRSVLADYVACYNRERPHRILGLQAPEPRPRPTTGSIRSRPVLNGLHHVYERAAWTAELPSRSRLRSWSFTQRTYPSAPVSINLPALRMSLNL